MKSINIFISALLIVLISLISKVNGISYVNPSNNHVYEAKLSSFNFAQSKSDAVVNGGYLATITTQDEYQFIINTVLAGIDTTTNNFWIGATYNRSKQSYEWIDGSPESGMTMYNKSMEQSKGFTAFFPYQPDLFFNGVTQAEDTAIHLYKWGRYNDNDPTTVLQGYILEIGGNTDPIIIAPNTDDEFIMIKNLQSFNVDALNVTFNSTDSTKSFSCKLNERLPRVSDNAYYCRMIPMTGFYNVTFQDGTHPNWSLKYFHPNQPYISTIQADYSNSSYPTLTINGENFGSNISKISLRIDMSSIQVLTMLIPHRSFVCVYTSPTSYIDYIGTSLKYTNAIQIYVDGLFVNSTFNAYYNPSTSNLFSYINRGSAYISRVVSTRDGYIGRPTDIHLKSDIDLLGNMTKPLPVPLYYPSAPGSGTLNFVSGTKLFGQAILTLSPLKINNIFFPTECVADISITTQPVLYLNLGDYTFFGGNTTMSSLIVTQYDPIYSLSSPQINDQSFFLSTSGGYAFIKLQGLKLTTSNYTVTFGDNISLVGIPIFIDSSVRAVIPSGHGATIYPIKIYIDNLMAKNGTVNFKYLPPSIRLIESPSTAGGSVIVHGGSFSDSAEYITIDIDGKTTITGNSITLSKPHTQLEFNIAPGTGKHNMTITVDGLISQVTQFSYANPSILSYNVFNGKMYFQVLNVGSNLSLITFNFGSQILVAEQLVTMSSTQQLVVNLNQYWPNTTTLMISLTVDGLTSTPLLLTSDIFKPFIQNVDKIPTEGGIITIIGINLFERSNISVIYNAQPATICNNVVVVSNTSITCNIKSGIKTGQANTISLNYGMYYSNQLSLVVKSPYIDQCTSVPKYNNQTMTGGGIVTIFGSSFQLPINNITIGGDLCYPYEFMSYTMLECQFQGLVDVPLNQSLLVQVYADGLVGNGYKFIYTDDTPCSTTSISDNKCNGHGICQSGRCECYDGWTTTYCNTRINSTDTTPDHPIVLSPQETVFSSNFAIFFTHMREIDLYDQDVEIRSISDIQWETIKNDTENRVVTTQGTFPNSTIIIKVTSYVFNQTTEFFFGGEKLMMAPNMIKYITEISGWQFKGPLNQLQLIYMMASPPVKDTGDECQDAVDTTIQTSNSQTDLRWAQVKQGDSLFMVKFSNRMLINQRLTVNQVQLLSHSDTIFNQTFYREIGQDKIKNSMVIAMRISKFDNATLDPSYQMLVNPNNNNNNNSNGNCKKQNNALLIGLVVGLVGGSILVAASIVLIKKKLRYSTRFQSFKNIFKSKHRSEVRMDTR